MGIQNRYSEYIYRIPHTLTKENEAKQLTCDDIFNDRVGLWSLGKDIEKGKICKKIRRREGVVSEHKWKRGTTRGQGGEVLCML